MADPTNVLAVDDLKRRVAARDRADDRDRARGHRRAQRRASAARNMSEVLKQVSEEAAQSADVEVQQQKREEIDLDRLATDSEDAPVIKIVNLILVQAIKEKASDIHIEPSRRR